MINYVELYKHRGDTIHAEITKINKLLDNGDKKGFAEYEKELRSHYGNLLSRKNSSNVKQQHDYTNETELDYLAAVVVINHIINKMYI